MNTIGSLFSGIGGLDKGLEDAGAGKVVWQCENNTKCQDVLAKHWPDVTCYSNIIDLKPPKVDILCGGFPCQDLSDAARGKNTGLKGRRSGLAYEFMRVISHVRPRVVVMENVDGAARKRWVPQLRTALWEIGYASLQVRLRACDIGAPFKGNRIFLLASPDCNVQSTLAKYGEVEELQKLASLCREDWGQASPTALGVAHGIPRGVDRRRMTGNAVVPQCAKVIGLIIKEALE